jgi:hypothetical protein
MQPNGNGAPEPIESINEPPGSQVLPTKKPRKKKRRKAKKAKKAAPKRRTAKKIKAKKRRL